MAAAVGMLDEDHDTLPQNPRDNNSYTLGRIGDHNVVIVCLPAGIMGTTSAALVATQMLITFRGLRFGLMVGIGGGVPSKEHDIRLGDVVVSTPTRVFGGVIQYDIRKVAVDGRFMRTGSLAKPPDVLLGALAKLRAKQIVDGTKLANHISKTMTRYPRMAAQYAHPGIAHDSLYEADYDHVVGDATCSHCDISRRIVREPRSSLYPAIHYGLIASGNMIMKDGSTRDKLGQELGVLCVEMEAAGLMDSFPCLVIRGICDYADSHKNKRWQHYAAMTAAAYTKELVYTVPVHVVESSATAVDVLDIDIHLEETLEIASQSSETASQSSTTLIGDSDPSLINTAAEEVARVLASDRRLKPLCVTGVLRMTPPVFRRNLTEVLVNFGKAMRKEARTPLEHAVAWILVHRKDHIAFAIYEEISPPEDFAATEILRLDQIPLALGEQEHLQRFINDRFPISQQKFKKGKHLEVDEVDSEIQEQTGAEGDDDAPPELSTLVDLQNLHQILCDGGGYWEAYKKMKLVVFPSPRQQLEKVLRRHLARDGGPQVVNCLIEWELLEYMDSESVTETELDSILTLTGDLDCACATRLGEYMCRRWATGSIMLDAMKALIGPCVNGNGHADRDLELNITRSLGHEYQFRIQLQHTQREKEQALVQISGLFHQIVETLEQLAWLAATLRPCGGERLTVSEIIFRTHQMEVGSLLEPVFQLSLFGQTQGAKPVADEPGQCWTSLFTESILAYGFSPGHENRPEGILGLEIPFEIMSSFAKVQYPILFGNRIIFAGDSTLLIPEVSFDDSIQWHYLYGRDRFEQARRVKVIDPKLQTLDLKALTKSRAFLGFCRSSEVVLGTKRFSETRISDSQVPSTGPKLRVELQGPITAGVNAKGYATISAGSTWKFRGEESGQIRDEQLSLDDRLQRARGTPALLYDDQTCQAFLVSELSVILHMVSAYLGRNSRIQESMIPYAEPSPDGGQAAYNVILKAQDLDIPFGVGKPRKYAEIVDDFVKIFEQRKMQTCARRKEIEVSLKVGLRGWDFVDLQKKTYEFFERELPTSLLGSRPVWWKLFKKSGFIVLFGRNIGYPIRKASSNDQEFCNSWVEIPTGKHLLLANMTSLIKLKRGSCKKPNKYPGHYMITDKLAWARPIGSQLFERCIEGGSCKPVQTMCRVGKFRYWRRDAFLPHPGEILDKGAVLFGDQPSAFASRPCHFVRSPPPKKYSFSFLAFISAAGIILAYSLARLLPMLK